MSRCSSRLDHRPRTQPSNTLSWICRPHYGRGGRGDPDVEVPQADWCLAVMAWCFDVFVAAGCCDCNRRGYWRLGSRRREGTSLLSNVQRSDRNLHRNRIVDYQYAARHLGASAYSRTSQSTPVVYRGRNHDVWSTGSCAVDLLTVVGPAAPKQNRLDVAGRQVGVRSRLTLVLYRKWSGRLS